MPLAPLPTVPRVDLSRFMGDWHVIANISSPGFRAASVRDVSQEIS
jgi:hypothetical protein